MKGISDEHVASIERFQPYKAGNWIKDLQTFSNWYRHTGLIKVQKVFQRPEEMNSEFFAAISLEDGRPIVQTLEEIERRVRETINELKPLLARYLSNFI